MSLILFSGYARSGKDTAAMAVKKEFEQNRGEFRVFIRPFAGPIKEACRLIFGWDDRHLYGDLKETIDPHYGVSPRFAMQTLGTEWGREIINDQLWVLRVLEEYKKLKQEHGDNVIFVVPDCRFPNEATTCRLEAPEDTTVIRIFSDRDSIKHQEHDSERLVDGVHYDDSIHNTNITKEFYEGLVIDRVEDILEERELKNTTGLTDLFFKAFMPFRNKRA